MKELKGKLCCWPARDMVLEYLSKNEGNYLEIGVYNGVAIAAIAETFPQKFCYGIDPFISDGNTPDNCKDKILTDEKNNTYDNIKDLPNVKLYEMTSKEFLEKNKDFIQSLGISVILVDGSHHYEDILIDIEICVTVLKNNNGLIYFDDMHLSGVGKGVEYFLENYKNNIQESWRNQQNGCIVKFKGMV